MDKIFPNEAFTVCQDKQYHIWVQANEWRQTTRHQIRPDIICYPSYSLVDKWNFKN